ncbi:MAG TPA: PASTA domain-containing protein, partial [Bacillaceae bacterium]
DVGGDEYDEAVMILTEAGLKVGDRIETPSNDVEEGSVIKSDPKAGRKVKKGSSVNLYISTGKERFTLADYTGQQYEGVVKLLEDEGFKDIVQEGRHDDSPEGTILEQSPGADEEVIPEETVLTFTVSLGEEKVTLKNLSGFNVRGLEDYEESTGLQIDMSVEEYSDTVPAGLVMSQDPKPGTELKKGSRVKVIMSKGQQEIPPKTVIKDVTIPYEPEEEGAEQEIKIFIEDVNNPSMTVPAETFTITETVKRQIKLTVQKGKKAGFKIIRDNTVILEDEVTYPED